MIIAIMSDLHFECYQDRGEKFTQSLDPSSVDILVLAGDIISTKNYDTMVNVLKRFCEKYKNVIYVPGNHEYYNNNVYRIENRLKRLAKEFTNIYILYNANSVTIDGQRFIGGTMWFEEDYKNNQYKKFMNDFFTIEKFEPWVYERNREFSDKITQRLNSNDIVITHHLPSDKSVHYNFKGDPLNPFFLHDMEKLILEVQPKMWIHGHTHFCFNYNIGKTRIICNPRAYPGENQGPLNPFNPNLKVEINDSQTKNDEA